MFGKQIRIESRMLNCTHILEIVFSPLRARQGPKTTIQLDNSPKCLAKKIRIESRMLNCTHIFEIDKNLLSRNPKMEQYLLWIFMFGTKIKDVELYTSFRICAFPLRAQRQQSNLITPPNVWQKNQNRIKKLRKYKNTAFVSTPFWRDLRVNGGGEETNSWMCVKPNIFHSNLTFGGD